VKAEERHKRILAIVTEYGFVDAYTLSDLLSVSVATIRRDFIHLDRRGKVHKKHGGIVVNEQRVGAPLNYPEVPDAVMEERQQIGRRAVALLEPGDTIFIGPGTTCRCFAQHIQDVPDIKIVTNSFGVVRELAQYGKQVVFCGGATDREGDAFFTTGLFAINNLKNLYIRKLFMTVNGISIEHGLTINSHMLFDLFSVLHRQAEETIVMADATKFNHRAFSYFCPLNCVSSIVTSANVPKEYVEYCSAHGVRLLR